MRIRIDLAYDGSEFSGWATQPGLRTVQAELEAALATSLRIPSARVVCAGRTDTGVHARGQVVHVDVDDHVLAGSVGRSRQTPAEALRRRLNGILPPDIKVRRVAEAPAGFDARFSALWRRYAYRIVDDPTRFDPLHRAHVLEWSRRLDVDALNAASDHLLGQHDFAAFCKRREGATTIRTLLDLHWTRDAHGVVEATVRADAFCHSMVRALVGCLLAVGDGRQPVGWPHDVLVRGVRDPAVTVAHAHGLTLEEVAYPDDAELRARAEQTRAKRVAADAHSDATSGAQRGATGEDASDG
ncbi:tRNA pseudouridine(38-40) synthase TruA [Nocardioides sp.]|uniref:tRNA pseudouridine(38-40) synthase TruA n=1 Tax=Nocardioides sp. TaxID=35761 RepID=UPI0035629A5F